MLRLSSIYFYFAIFSIVSAVRADPPATLKSVFGGKFDIGAAIGTVNFRPAEQDLLLKNFTTVTPENCMKPAAIEPREGQFTFDRADALVAFAGKNGLKVNGHTLLWHQQTPDWFFLDGDKPASRDLILKRLRNHITTEVARYRGKMYSWDVVNEVVSDDPKQYLRKSKWVDNLGEDFIADAFVTAHAADPSAKLYYNDYSIEQPNKRAKAIRLIRQLKSHHVPIDGVGIQGHWSLDRIPYQAIEDSIAAFHAEGLVVNITELDLDVVPRASQSADIGQQDSSTVDPYATGCPPEVLQREADQYAKLFTLFEKHADQMSRITFWGLDDGRSWLNGWPRKRTNYPLLFGRDLQPKPAFFAVLNSAIK
jgi:endo-1,4-beta-xylanase